MKQEILETTSQNITQGKNSNIQTLNISYFYKIFHERNKHLSLYDYKKIIYAFLKIYFIEMYNTKAPTYFFLGGMMKIVKYAPWIRKQKRGYDEKEILCRSDDSLGLFWFHRPSMKTYYMVKLKKQTGSTNAIPIIERKFKENMNQDLLPIFTKEQKKGKRNKTLYRCIQT